jgi:c-di-GMP-binding flagellar brake protein YcgR
MANPETRRAHPRRVLAGVDLACYRTVPGPEPQARRNIGRELVDISPGGARVRVSEPLPAGERVTLELRERTSGETFRARGEVRWCATRRAGVASGHFVGLQFLEVYTPVGRRERFTVAVAADPEPHVAPAEKRAAERFSIQDYIVTVLRQGVLASDGLKRNLAREVLDLSRVGAQVLVSEPLEPGTLVRFALHFNALSDSLESSGEVRWCRPDGSMRYRAGIRFVNLPEDRRRMIDFLRKRFSGGRKA